MARDHEVDGDRRADPVDDPVDPGYVPELNLGIDAASFEVARDGARLSQVCERLGVATRGRHRVGAPVVQGPRDVSDPVRSLHQSQHEVVILAPIESRLKPADVDGQRAAVDAEVTRVHERRHVLGRPARLWVVLDQPLVTDYVLVGVDHVEVGSKGDLVGDLRERVGGEGVVVVEESDVLAGGEFERRVRRGRDPAGRLVTPQVDAVV